MNPTAEKMLWTVGAVAIYALSAWPPMAPVAEGLKVAAGGCLGAAFVPSVNERHAAAKARASQAPPAP